MNDFKRVLKSFAVHALPFYGATYLLFVYTGIDNIRAVLEQPKSFAFLLGVMLVSLGVAEASQDIIRKVDD
jgi:hypothetical protein